MGLFCISCCWYPPQPIPRCWYPPQPKPRCWYPPQPKNPLLVSTAAETMLQGGRTPLMWAAVKGHLEVVMYLASHGSQLEATDWFGQTPLMLAAEGGHLEVVMYLVSQGSQLEATSTTMGMTPLMWAAWGGHLEVVTYLVSHGSQLEATYPDGQTALHLAAQYGQIDVTKWLTDQGCSPWVKTKQSLDLQTLIIPTHRPHFKSPINTGQIIKVFNMVQSLDLQTLIRPTHRPHFKSPINMDK
ncbi:unnamed protein product [Mytilus edulis]|uniref:Uncharacterized protein n=1 Tax=Mytilus edulis TaxID=6550 RepID=A0A8S3TGB3_MYTED|nr:unnamed protein product [Mytilus edulis]